MRKNKLTHLLEPSLRLYFVFLLLFAAVSALFSVAVAVIEARIAIETEAAALAAERRTPADLRMIRRALILRDERRGNAIELVDADTAFHRAIVAAAHNPILIELFDGFTPRLRQAMIDMLRIRPDHTNDADHEAHADLVQTIADRDASGAALQSRAHLQTMKAALA